MTEIRCVKCKGMLMKADIKFGTVEIKCRKCGYMNKIVTPERKLRACDVFKEVTV